MSFDQEDYFHDSPPQVDVDPNIYRLNIVLLTGIIREKVNKSHFEEICGIWGTVNRINFGIGTDNLTCATIEFEDADVAMKAVEFLDGMNLNHGFIRGYLTNEADPEVAQKALQGEIFKVEEEGLNASERKKLRRKRNKKNREREFNYVDPRDIGPYANERLQRQVWHFYDSDSSEEEKKIIP